VGVLAADLERANIGLLPQGFAKLRRERGSFLRYHHVELPYSQQRAQVLEAADELR
jgi:hypothetical protein